ncbi:MAG: DsrE family protein [Nitrospiraceae bacterium]|nr:DsrE family protein [Nitrospiraceae bacterium]
MKLGILVNTDRHLDDIMGMTSAAISKGHEVIIFVMDKGINLINNQVFKLVHKFESVKVFVCSQDAVEMGLSIDNVSEGIVMGSQYDNALMVHEADRVIVL